MTINDARELALALNKTMPTDPVRKAKWIHVRNCLREILREEIDLLDLEKWENLASQ